MINITKRDLTKSVSETTGITQVDSINAIEGILSTISDFLQQGNTIQIRNFGTFKIKKTKARPARNPKTGEVVYLKPDFRPIFKYSSKIKKGVGVNTCRKIH